jgi:hypothetical protein
MTTKTKRKKPMAPTITEAASTKLTLVDKKPRSVLCEGRNYGIGFAFAKRKGNELHLVGPISPCREYLNDQLYSELTKKPTSCYGYKAKYEGLLEDEVLYLVCGVMPYQGGHKYAGQVEETKWMAANHRYVQWFLNEHECALGKFGISNITELETNRYVIEVPRWWGRATYLISLLSLLVRVALEGRYTPNQEDGKANVAMAWLPTAQTREDNYNLGPVKEKIEKMVAGQFPTQNLDHISPHSAGILNQKFQ